MHKMGAEIQLSCYTSIHQIDENEWDSIVSSHDVFHSYKFIRATEDSKVENSKYWYLLFFQNNKLIATTILSAFTISLDLFIGDNSVVRVIKKLRPDFFKIKILVCGLPVSLGQRNLIVVNERFFLPVIKLISEKMQEICQEEKIKFQTIKEFKENEIAQMGIAETNGFFLAHSIPYMKMQIKWDSFEEYLSELRHGFRRQIKGSLKKINRSAPSVCLLLKERTSNFHQVELILDYQEVCSPAVFYQLYLCVMERATTKLETLNLDFFVKFYKEMNGKMKLLVLKKQQEILGAAILVGHGDELTFALVGKGKDKDYEYDTYFNLLYGIVEIAINEKYKLLNLGQTCYWTKQRIGAFAVKEYIYFKSTNHIRHMILKIFNKLIFPDLKLKKIEVFKHN